MTKSFRESLTEILDAYGNRVARFENKGKEMSWGKELTAGEAKAALIEVVRGLVPEENKSWGYGSSPEGWNACRQAILKKMEE